ncbi:uncharacterized protein LY89DRAFT_670906 [Mollisia scopiformis]|uniref:Uncharacterized protein n=1 Tax=Mollisia scopiformis TaxID=149040 RepID=A0A194X5T1_MOLSC|nr:uncharacterized protein LY89DRAFT_670906 [Mollisia scopiformis]KUJ15434.1 hypothetical protein LY89DRAFT_670906 [Mollisia scopiformis]
MSSQELLHEPPSISPEEFEFGRLKPLSHSAESISKAIIQFNKRETYSVYSMAEDPCPRRRMGAENFKHHGTWNLGNPHNLEDIKKYFGYFNDVYFNGLLTGYCTLELVDGGAMKRRYGSDCGGRCQPYFPGEEIDSRHKATKPQIIITIRSLANYRDKYAAIKEYHLVILHEMLHAMFDIFECRCYRGCLDRTNREASGGHHIAWQAAAKALERGVWLGANPFDLYFDLRREVCLAADMMLGNKLPNEATLRILRLDIELILKSLKEQRAEENQDLKERSAWSRLIRASNSCISKQQTVDAWDRNFGFERDKWPYRSHCMERGERDLWGMPSSTISANELWQFRA